MNTNTNVEVDVKPKVAGITRGSLKNDWLDCPFEIHPGPPGARGVVWKALYFEKDTGYSRPFAGAAETRNHATQVVCEVLTAHIAAVVELRKKGPVALVRYEPPTSRLTAFWVFLKSLLRF